MLARESSDQKKVARLTARLRIVFKMGRRCLVATVIPLNSLEGIIAYGPNRRPAGRIIPKRWCAPGTTGSSCFWLEARHKIYCSPEARAPWSR